MNKAPASLRCRHCRADNFAEEKWCWLCGAPDWDPSAHGPAHAKAAAAAGRPTSFPLGTTLVLALVLFTTVMVVVGLAHRHTGLALVVGAVWWLGLGVVILRRKRLRPVDTVTSLMMAVAMAVALTVVLAIAAVIFLFIVCVTNGLPRLG